MKLRISTSCARSSCGYLISRQYNKKEWILHAVFYFDASVGGSIKWESYGLFTDQILNFLSYFDHLGGAKLKLIGVDRPDRWYSYMLVIRRD